MVIEGRYRGGFTICRPGVCLKGEGMAEVLGDGMKNAICVSSNDCLITGVTIAHATHALHVTGAINASNHSISVVALQTHFSIHVHITQASTAGSIAAK